MSGCCHLSWFGWYLNLPDLNKAYDVILQNSLLSPVILCFLYLKLLDEIIVGG